MKRAIILFVMFMGMVGLSACVSDNLNTSDTSTPDRPEKMYEDVAAEDFKQVHISGNASSIVIRCSESENFEFYNGDLNPAHTYTVRCDKNGETLNIEVMMCPPPPQNGQSVPNKMTTHGFQHTAFSRKWLAAERCVQPQRSEVTTCCPGPFLAFSCDF